MKHWIHQQAEPLVSYYTSSMTGKTWVQGGSKVCQWLRWKRGCRRKPPRDRGCQLRACTRNNKIAHYPGQQVTRDSKAAVMHLAALLCWSLGKLRLREDSACGAAGSAEKGRWLFTAAKALLAPLLVSAAAKAASLTFQGCQPTAALSATSAHWGCTSGRPRSLPLAWFIQLRPLACHRVRKQGEMIHQR